jgi:glycosyltransferase involved in cell wall biosynthesis
VTNAQLPFVSVVMPVRNEQEHIEYSLEAVLRQDYPADRMEVIVVDGASEDSTVDIATKMAGDARAKGSAEVILMTNPDKTAPVSLNLALARARGEVIVRVDGHTEIARDYVSRCMDAFGRTGADNVGGVQRAVGRTSVGRAIALATGSRFGAGDARFRYAKRESWVDTVYMGAFRRSIFDKVGSFDEELVRNQDDEFNLRVRSSGGRVFLDPAIKSTYRPREKIGALWDQYFGYGFYKVLVMRKHRRISSWRQLVPAAFIVALVASVIFAAATRFAPIAAIVAGPYLIAVLTVSFWLGRKDPESLILLQVVFPTLHFAYGSGFLAGLWRWRRRPIKALQSS